VAKSQVGTADARGAEIRSVLEDHDQHERSAIRLRRRA
jgi:hypothetical protein